MAIEKCASCGSKELFHTVLLDAYLKLSMMQGIALNVAVCEDCGHVMTYIDDKNFTKLKKWKAKNIK